jgi:HEPN domain-containing protein
MEGSKPRKPIRMSLRENAYDFLNESIRSAARARDEPSAWKFAVLNVVQAIELLLKARLFEAHPVLVFENVDRPNRTVSLSLAVNRIKSAAGIHLTSREERTIRKAQKWRDQIIHHEFEFSAYEVESVYVQLFEFLVHFHDERTDFGPLHSHIDSELWPMEAELIEFFRREFVAYNGAQVVRRWPAQIVAAQSETTIELHGKEYRRLPYGVEPGWEMSADSPCHDCGIRKGQLHVANCDVEACPRCFGQVITCGCFWDEGPPDSDLEPLDVLVARYRQTIERKADDTA